MHRFLALLLFLGSLSVSHGTEKKDDTSTKITGTFTVPATHPTANKVVLQVLLFEFDPLLADVSATLVDKIELKDFTHEKGKETVKKFELGAKGTLNEKRRYYLTVFLLDGDKRVSRGVLDHDKGGIGKVLTDGNPREVKITAKAID
jgi:hypothetical protein